MHKHLQTLRQIPALAQVPEAELEWLRAQSTVRHLSPGDFLFRKGDPIDQMHIVLSGVLSLKVEQSGQYRESVRLGAGSITGALPYSRAKNAMANGEAQEPAEVLSLPKTEFPEMIRTHYELVEALVHTMTTRVREFTAARQQDDKMMALGKLSAGLAHELNNPVSAIVRGAQAFRAHTQLIPKGLGTLVSAGFSGQQVEQIHTLLTHKMANGLQTLTMIQRSDLEDELMEWLEAHGVAEADELAEHFADFGLNTEELDELAQAMTEPQLVGAMEWMASVLLAEKMAEEIEQASRRVSELVGAIKSYSHMDRSQDQSLIDLWQGIESTLTLLNHKLKSKQIKVLREQPDALPRVNAFPSELNQVWTNLIDNAIDAMEQGGILRISTQPEGDAVRIVVADNGSGIPEDVQPKIFDPFFTTKKIGQGTGLGLELVWNIIVNRHNGSIKVRSEPGKTEFEICLPTGKL